MKCFTKDRVLSKNKNIAIGFHNACNEEIHIHDFLEFVYISDGEGYQYIDEKKYTSLLVKAQNYLGYSVIACVDVDDNIVAIAKKEKTNFFRKFLRKNLVEPNNCCTFAPANQK